MKTHQLLSLLLFLLGLLIFSTVGHAQTTRNWDSPPDVNELTSDHALLLYCSTCSLDTTHKRMRNWVPTSIGNFPDVDTTGAATNDIMYLSADGNFYFTSGNSLISGGGGGASALNDLSDVDETGVATGDILYQSADGNWYAQALYQNVYGDGVDTVVIGENAIAGGQWSVAIGENADAGTGGNSRIAIGKNADTGDGTGLARIAIGNNATCATSTSGQASCLAIGRNADASGSNNTAIGYNTVSTGGNTVAIGVSTSATGNNSAAFGSYSTVSHDNSFAITSGFYNQAASTKTNQGVLGTSDMEIYVPGDLVVDGTITNGAIIYASVDGTDGQVLTTDGAGNIGFEDAASGLSGASFSVNPFIESPQEKTYPLFSSSVFTATTVGAYGVTSDGSINAVFQINGATISGSSVTFNSAGDYVAFSSGIAVGDNLDMVLSSSSGALADLEVNLEYTR